MYTCILKIHVWNIHKFLQISRKKANSRNKKSKAQAKASHKKILQMANECMENCSFSSFPGSSKCKPQWPLTLARVAHMGSTDSSDGVLELCCWDCMRATTSRKGWLYLLKQNVCICCDQQLALATHPKEMQAYNMLPEHIMKRSRPAAFACPCPENSQ